MWRILCSRFNPNTVKEFYTLVAKDIPGRGLHHSVYSYCGAQDRDFKEELPFVIPLTSRIFLNSGLILKRP